MAPAIFTPETARALAEIGAENQHPVLRAMEEEAAKRRFPIIGPEVGRVMAQLALLRRPKRILELGSGYGYSAITWALALGGEVAIDCTEFDEANIAKAHAYAEQAGVRHCLRYHQGDALGNARRLEGPWDILLCDIDKHEYPAAWEFIRAQLRPGDLFLFDNMVWSGRIAEPEADWDDNTRAIVATRRAVYADPDIAASMLPIRDGVLLGVRK